MKDSNIKVAVICKIRYLKFHYMNNQIESLLSNRREQLSGSEF